MMYSDYEQSVFTECADAWLHEDIITDATAQAIAAWWHSPASPNSTRLSTMGVVTCETRLSDFANEAEFRDADTKHRMALESLDRYITHMQNTGRVTHDAECVNG